MHTKKIEVLESLIERINQVREYEDSLAKLFGAYPDGGSYAAVEELVATYTQLVADTVGSSLDTLEWFIYDNECGAKGLEAGIDEDMREIRTTEDFMWFVTGEEVK